MKKIPELLAPAGDLNAALTAFQYGADAVYAGLSKFNARERTQNFSPEDYGKLMAAAAADGKKVYLTFNTLIKENELAEALEDLYGVCRLLPDAVIVQDLGVLSMMKRYFPHIPVHASTQMGIHNSAGMYAAEKLGIERVILERQVTIEELKSIRKKTRLEMEVFIHGALCCSLSGVCLFSSWMGGHSGNRGKCKQPCRRRYYSPDGNGFFFSTNDLYTLEQIPVLKKIGIESLKIEGRLRKSDYVASTVSAYRMILDADEKDVRGLLPEARAMLSGALGRRWSTGFFDKRKYDQVIEPTQPGVSGKACGIVKDSVKSGFTMKTFQVLYLGDKIRVQPKNGDEGPAVTLTKMSIRGKKVTRVPGGEDVFIHCDKSVPTDGLVFKIGTSVKDIYGRMENLPALQDRIDLKITLQQHRLTVKIKYHPHLEPIILNTELQIAEKHPVTAELINAAFQKAGNTQLGVRNTESDIRGDFFMSQRDIRHLRQRVDEILKREYVPVPKPQLQEYPLPGQHENTEHTLAVKDRNAIPADFSFDRLATVAAPRTDDEMLLPFFCVEDELDFLKEEIHRAFQNGIRRFRVTALFHFALLEAFQDIVISSTFPLSASNHIAVEQLRELGVKKVQLWVELERSVLKMLAQRYGALAEIYVYGRLPILQTRAQLPVSGTVNDSRGAAFHIETGNPLSLLYPEAVYALQLKGFPPVSTFTDLMHARPDEKNVSKFNYERELA